VIKLKIILVLKIDVYTSKGARKNQKNTNITSSAVNRRWVLTDGGIRG